MINIGLERDINLKSKKIAAIIQVQLPCNIAKNDSVIGPTFGQYGIKGIDFCKKYNEYTVSQKYPDGLIIKTMVIIYKDRSFDFLLKTPPIFFLFSKIVNLENIINVRDLYKVLKIKKKDVYLLSFKQSYKNLLQNLKTYKYEIQ